MCKSIKHHLNKSALTHKDTHIDKREEKKRDRGLVRGRGKQCDRQTARHTDTHIYRERERREERDITNSLEEPQTI